MNSKKHWRRLGARAAAIGILLTLGADARADGGDTAAEKSATGITQAVFDVALSLPVPGIVTVRHVKEGAFVQKGDVILELDHRLEELEVERRRFVMENQKADFDSTKAVFAKTASISRDELLKKEADYNVAATEYSVALEELQRRELVAPAAGVITELTVSLGEACTAYQPVARLVDTRHCYFTCNLDSALGGRLKTGQAVKLAIDDPSGPIQVDASIVFVSPTVDSASGLQRVKALFDNSDGRVRPGVTGRMILN